MFDAVTVIVAFCLYVCILFCIATWVEHKLGSDISLANNPLVYSLSLAVYCTSWTYYGSVGKAADAGMLFLTIYIGPTLALLLGWTLLRKMVRIKIAHRITSIADFISARYNRSESLAALVSFIALVGIAPYIALQLKAVISTFKVITIAGAKTSWIESNVGPIVVALMILFTNVFGVRRLDPTERHPGMVTAVALESIVKLAAFLFAGIFITYFICDGFTDIFQQIAHNRILYYKGLKADGFTTWTTYIILAMSAIFFLPRQFHVAVVENFNEKHIRTAMWLFPLYMVLINFFVFPIAMAGLLNGSSAREADNLLLSLPLSANKRWLSLFVFIGGFSAATSMIMISSMTLGTMITNHLLLPIMDWVKWLGFLRRHLLKCRWVAVAGVIAIGYWFESKLGESYMLVNMGMISFAAVFQFVPSAVGGLFWRRGNKIGAISGLSAGFAVWLYTLLIPAFIQSNWGVTSLLTDGPWGMAILKPQQFLGLEVLDPLSHTLFWSALFNTGLYVIGSMFFEQNQEEKALASEFVDVLAETTPYDRQKGAEAYIDAAEKKGRFENLLRQYFPRIQAIRLVESALNTVGISGKSHIGLEELAELYGEVEKTLAGAVGSAAAHSALKRGGIYTPQEVEDLKFVYGEILARLKITPEDLKKKVHFYEERELMFNRYAKELEVTVKKREKEIISRRKEEESTLRRSEKRLSQIVQGISVPIFVIDNTHTITHWNKACEKISGYAAKEMIGTRSQWMPFYEGKRPVMADLIVDGQSEAEIAKYYSGKYRKSAFIETAYEAVDFFPDMGENGTWMYFTAAPLKDIEGKVIGAIETLQDITEQKRSNQALRESEERYRTVLEASPDPIAVYDMEGNASYINPVFTRVFGWSLEEMKDGKIDYVPESEKEVTQRVFDRVRRGEDFSFFDTRRSTKDGEILDINMSGAILRNTDKVPFGSVVILRDVTQRKKAEARLKESEEKYRNLFESAPEGILITTLDGQILSANAAVLKMFRFTGRKTELFSRNIREFYKDPEIDRTIMSQSLMVSGQLEDYQVDYRDMTGRIFPASLFLRLIQYENRTCVQTIVRDITNIKKLEAELRDYAENLQRKVNEKTRELQSTNEELSTTVRDLKETQEKLSLSAHRAGMAEVAVTVLHNIGNVTNSLNVRTFLLEELLSARELGSLEKIYTYLASETLLTRATEAERSNREKLLAFFSTTIEILKTKSATIRDDLEFLRKGLNHIVEINAIQQEYAGLRGFETRVNINALLHDAVELLMDSIAKRGIEVNFECKDLPELLLNKNKMVQIFVNVVKNAYEAIDMAPPENEKRITLKTAVEKNAQKEYVWVMISDTGAGLPPEIREKVYRFNFSTKGRGTGLGLHDTANYIKAQGGLIDLVSVGPGKGSHLVIKLPTSGAHFDE